jgi:hypothetical protein
MFPLNIPPRESANGSLKAVSRVFRTGRGRPGASGLRVFRVRA